MTFLGLFKIDANKRTMPIGEQELTEKELAELVEKNPGMVPDVEGLLLIGKEVPTDYNTRIDLLGVNLAGNTVIIELKKGITPRDVIAQILEYAVYIEKLGYEELSQISSAYSNGKSLRELYIEFFAEGTLETIVENVNSEQILIIIAKEIDPKIEELALYLTKRQVNLRVLKYTYFSVPDGENYMHIDTVVGKDDRKKIQLGVVGPVPDFYKLLDKVVEKVQSDEFSAPDIYEIIKEQFPNELAKLQEKYKGSHYTPKNHIALNLYSYSRRNSAPFVLTDKTTEAPSEWGFPTVKLFQKKNKK